MATAITEKTRLLEHSCGRPAGAGGEGRVCGRRYGSRPVPPSSLSYQSMATKQQGSGSEDGDAAGRDHQVPPERDHSNYRRLTRTSAYIPPVRRTWRESIKRLLVNIYNLNYRRVSSHSNVVHTTKYTLLTFLPKNLLEQFHRAANLYFLLIIILNFIPAIEAFAKEVSWIPLFCVLTVTAVKDAIEDIRRYRSDKKVNASTCEAYDR